MTHARRLWAIPALAVAVAALLFSDQVHEALLGALAAAQRLADGHAAVAAGLVVLFAALAAMLAFVSSALVVPFAVYTWGTLPTLLLLWAGWLVGGATAYVIGRFIGRPAIGWITSPSLLEKYERRLSHRSTFGLILLLQLALPSELPGYLLGIIRYPFGWYFAALAIAELVHGIPAVLLGASVVERRTVVVVPLAVGWMLLTLGAAYGLQRRLRAERPGDTVPTPGANAPDSVTPAAH